jgi:hypothetical protein
MNFNYLYMQISNLFAYVSLYSYVQLVIYTNTFLATCGCISVVLFIDKYFNKISIYAILLIIGILGIYLNSFDLFNIFYVYFLISSIFFSLIIIKEILFKYKISYSLISLYQYINIKKYLLLVFLYASLISIYIIITYVKRV